MTLFYGTWTPLAPRNGILGAIMSIYVVLCNLVELSLLLFSLELFWASLSES